MTSETRHPEFRSYCLPSWPRISMVQKSVAPLDGFTSRWRAVVCGGAVVAMAVMYNLYAETAAENAELRRTLAKAGLIGVRDEKTKIGQTLTLILNCSSYSHRSYL